MRAAFIFGAFVLWLFVWAMGEPMGGALALLWLYMIPSFIAGLRGMAHPGPTVVVNLMFGWTFIGWAIALAMSFGGPLRAKA